MQVMHVGDSRDFAQRAAERLDVDIRRRALEQDADGLPWQRPGSRHDEEFNARRHQRIGVAPSGRPDHHRREDHAHRTDQIRQDLEVRTLDVEALVGARRQDLDTNDSARLPVMTSATKNPPVSAIAMASLRWRG